MDVIKNIEAQYTKASLPEFGPGDTVRVHVSVVEDKKVRTQIFQGVVVGRRGSGTRATFTVRKVSAGVAVERIFPLHSPSVKKIEVARRGRVRRAKLYYLETKSGKQARIKEKARSEKPRSKATASTKRKSAAARSARPGRPGSAEADSGGAASAEPDSSN
jgi:large subunit ribosomal protein L19